MHVEAIYIALVKSLALLSVQRAFVTKTGLVGDRRFFLVDERGRLFTQREFGPLATVRASLVEDSDLLRIEFPGGRAFEAEALPGDPLAARFFGKYDVAAFAAPGPWDEALTQFVGSPVRLVAAGEQRSGVDALPVSLLTAASVEALRRNSGEPSFDAMRFRPNIYVAGAGRAHEEDEWLGGKVRVGSALHGGSATLHGESATVIHVRMRDERCVMTTLNPRTGVKDFNTLRMIADYRTDQPKEVNFGVYGTVVQPGEITVGDQVTLLPGTTAPNG
jgi:uncharacterized protein YcbX